MDAIFYIGLAITGFGAGMLGALLGLGGGVFVVPALVLLFGIPTHPALGTSNVAVIATSTSGASTYVRSRLTNIRLGLLLLTSTAFAAFVSSLIASSLPDQVLKGLFSVLLVYTAITMLRGDRTKKVAVPLQESAPSSPLGLEGSFRDVGTGKDEFYSPRRVGVGMGVNALAGVMAGLLGVGGGIIQMPVMNLLMKVPLKVATGTSNFMIGVTATSAAFVRYAHGDINPLLVVPVTLFVFLGARLGAWLVPRTPNARLRLIFGWIAIAIALLMALQAAGIYKI